MIMNALNTMPQFMYMYVWGVSLVPPSPNTHTHKRTNEEDLWIRTREINEEKEKTGERDLKLTNKWIHRSACNWGSKKKKEKRKRKKRDLILPPPPSPPPPKKRPPPKKTTTTIKLKTTTTKQQSKKNKKFFAFMLYHADYYRIIVNSGQ